MTLEELSEKKAELEHSILLAIQKFESYRVSIYDIDLFKHQDMGDALPKVQAVRVEVRL